MLTRIKCPTCRRETAWQGNPYRPFCSARCQTIDLGNWASERYRVAGAPAEVEADDDDEDGE
jgi:endogenous inhibitor of DNA gyrase (YacG/DUF329 family)